MEDAVLMGMPRWIAFAGPRATGKTTLAEYLVKHHGFTRMSLAAPIKRIIAECPTDSHERHQFLLRWGRELFPGSIILQARFATEAARVLAAERDPGRRAQLIGTDVGRALDQEVWIRYLLTHLPDGPVAVDDVRFTNECGALRQAGFVLIRLTAPPDVLAARLAARAAERRDPDHVSERGLEGLPDDYWDAVWDTSEPLDATVAKLEMLLSVRSEPIMIDLLPGLKSGDSWGVNPRLVSPTSASCISASASSVEP